MVFDPAVDFLEFGGIGLGQLGLVVVADERVGGVVLFVRVVAEEAVAGQAGEEGGEGGVVEGS
jgi:hypothetical protein